jgi:FAD/FMN-containing dehydrogenase/Fe-S oxidoreductase
MSKSKSNHSQIFQPLGKSISGDIHTDPLNRYMLSTDGSIFRVQPSAVAYPKNTADVVKIVEFAMRHSFNIHPRGAGSGLCGASLGKGIVLDFTKYMNRLISIDFKKKNFECEPGYRFGELEAALKGKGLFFPPDPSSGEYATLGGMYGTNASGAHSVKYGNVSDYIIDARVMLGTGEQITLSEILAEEYDNLSDSLKGLYALYEANTQKIETAYPAIRFNSTGYNLRGLIQEGCLNLKGLFAGSEGTLGIVTQLKFSLTDKPAYDSLVVAFFNDIKDSCNAVQEVLPLGPSGIEIMDKSLLKLARENSAELRDKIPAGIDNLLMIEYDSFDAEECLHLAEKTQRLLRKAHFTDEAYIAVSEKEKEKFWALRKAAVPVLYKLKGRKRILPLIEDAAVPTDKLLAYVKGIYETLNRHNIDFVLFGHIAKGLLHTRPLLDLKDSRDIELLKVLADDIFQLVYGLGGAISGEHGDGRIRSAYVQRQYPEIWDLFVETKQLLDPANILNPDIITAYDPKPMGKSLRFGSGYQRTHLTKKLLSWPEGFEDEIEKCHGCSKCTTVTTATRMCPIYKFTREESATPKAKANILRALISGAIDDRDLYKQAFQHVNDQCVNCGSCYQECPSNVNIPKMALETCAKYVKKFGPSLQNRLVVNAEIAGRHGRKFSKAVKPFLELNGLRKIGERITGISWQRKFIDFSKKSLFERIKPVEGYGTIKVMYFAGCYAGYIRPEIGESAIQILKHLKMTVLTPQQHCCGLPMLSKSMVEQASDKITRNLLKWENLLETVDFIVVTCSSCGLSLMEEWAYLIDNKKTKKIKRKVIHISRLINTNFERLKPMALPLRIAYHSPCHLKIQPDPHSSLNLLRKIKGIHIENLNSHCCGMAGTWGFSRANYELSTQIGSDLIRKLSQSGATIGVTDCPTCRMQMEQFTSRKIMHPVEILADCLNNERI